MTRHPVSVRFFHWASAILIVVSAAVVLSREITEHQPTRQILLELHRQLGLLILVGLLGRLVTRFKLGLANHAPNLGKTAHTAAQLAHWVMYGVIACITVIGWALTNAHAIKMRLLEVIPLPNLVAADSDLADTLSDWHIYAAWTLLGFVMLHVSAALWHHFRLRDHVLVAMLPGRTSDAHILEAEALKDPLVKPPRHATSAPAHTVVTR